MPVALDSRTWIHRGVADHAAARAAIARAHLEDVLGESPHIRRLAHGKPVLDAPHDHLWFSQGARDGLMVVAISHHGPVGADVETLDQCRGWETVAADFFSTAEQVWLAGLAQAARALGFAHLWTGKEAVLKAAGVGLRQGLALPDFGPVLGRDLLPHSLVVADGDGTPYTVVWAIHNVEDCLAVAARADAGVVRSSSLS